MLFSHLFTSCSCHIFICFPHTFFFFMHSYYSMHPLCLYLHLLFIHAFVLLILITCLCLFLSIFCSLLILFFPCSLHIAILSHLISCASWCTNYSFAHLPTCHFLLPFLLCYISGLSFHQIPILFTISMFYFATLLPYTSPPPSFTSFIVTISSSFYASFIIISVPYFSQPSFPFTFLLHIWCHICLALFCNIVVNLFRFLYLAVYLTILHLIYDTKYVYICSLFLECVGNNCLYIVFDIL